MRARRAVSLDVGAVDLALKNGLTRARRARIGRSSNAPGAALSMPSWSAGLRERRAYEGDSKTPRLGACWVKT